MLKQLTYASRATRSMNIMDLTDILKASRVNNLALDVTGALCIHSNTFLQQLEGEADVVTALYERIILDERHRDATILDLTEIPKRRFGKWSMGMLMDDKDSHPLFEKFTHNGQFDPYKMGVEPLRAFFKDVLGHTRWIN